MDPKDFLDLGVKLAGRQTLAEVRTGVSRIYYANHLLAVAQGTKKWGYSAYGSGEDHRGIIRFMKIERGGKLRAPALRLLRLLDARTHADYHIVKSINVNCLYCKSPVDDHEFDGEQIGKLLEDAQTLFRQLSSL